MSTHDYYPEMITSLPEADIPFPGVKGWISQGESHQVVYMDIEAIGEVKEHRHAAQWGFVFEGEMILRIDGKESVYRKGDSYFIPDQVNHSARFLKRTLLMDVFGQKFRYLPRENSPKV